MREECPLLYQLAKFVEAKNIVEIGVSKGESAVYLCRAAKENGGHYFGFDHWSVHGVANQYPAHSTKEAVEDLLNNQGFSGTFTLSNIDTTNQREQLIEKLTAIQGGIDFAFVDGCHSYNGVANDFFAVYPFMSSCGIIVLHDTLRIDGCREFVLDLRTIYNDGAFDIVDFPFGYADRRVGVTVVTKRSYPIINIGIDEACGSKSSPAEIETKEREWYLSQVTVKEETKTKINEPLRIDLLGYKQRKKFE